MKVVKWYISDWITATPRVNWLRQLNEVSNQMFQVQTTSQHFTGTNSRDTPINNDKILKKESVAKLNGIHNCSGNT